MTTATENNRALPDPVYSSAGFSDDEMGAGPGKRKPQRRERLCLDLMAWMLMDYHGTLDDYHAVMSGQMPCPLHTECEKYQRGKAAGKRSPWDAPNY